MRYDTKYRRKFIFYSYICLNIYDNYHQLMKTKKEYIQLIREYLDSTARKYGVTKMGLFGSVARDEQVDDSDIDIAYEGQANIFIRIRMKAELEKLLGCKVDIIRLHKNMADTLFGREVEKDIIYV